MERKEALERLEEICREVFEDDELEIREETTAADVEGWDSLTHLSLIHEIETQYKIKFTMGEIQGFQNVGELLDAMMRRTKER